MAVVPRGRLSVPINLLAEMVAESARFQTWTGSVDATEALTHVKLFELDRKLTGPKAMVTWGPQEDERTGISPDSQWFPSGNLLLYFKADMVDENGVATLDADNPETDFCNNVGDVMTEIEKISGTNAYYLNIPRVRLYQTPQRPDVEDQHLVNWWTVVYEVEWRLARMARYAT